ncbi:hypothetical protein [Streptomyces sp. NPDC016845]|uniref:hypothetical protein n=1 Tax=Streptomyces sp. NPDC016845 TaxID=3364972 RepID=UPI00379067FA
MRLPSRAAPALAAAALLAALPCDAVSDTTAHRHDPGHARVAAKKPERFGAGCRTLVEGVRATADCHNPYPGVDRVALHIECDPWWDIDTDTAPTDVGPAETVRLNGRCWKSVRRAWVSHEKADRARQSDEGLSSLPGRHRNG